MPNCRAVFVSCAVGSLALGASALAQPASLPVNVGEIVHTFEAPNDLGDVVVTLLDTSGPAVISGVSITPWNPPRFWNAGAGVNEWTRANLGQVFGVTLDAANNPNIYVTAASIYGQQQFGPGGSGAVYRLDGTTGAICHLISFPNLGRPGLGNITYAKFANSLYVSDFENGLIYQLYLGPNLNAPICPILDTGSAWDHGTQADLAVGPDDLTPGPTILGRRTWGLAYNERDHRLYYSVWWEDGGFADPVHNNQIWSVLLNASGGFVAGSAVLEVTLSPLSVGGNWSNPVAGIDFTKAGKLMLAERSMTGMFSSAHASRVLEYTGVSGAWVASPTNKFQTGNYSTHTNASGGIASDCEERIWDTGDAINVAVGNFIYGLQRTPPAGNAADVPVTLNCALIDSDNEVLNLDDKTQIGSVAIRRGQCECAIINDVRILCQISNTDPPHLTGNYTYTFTFTNNSGVPVYYISSGPNITFSNGQHSMSFGVPIANGATSPPITVTLSGAVAGQPICFSLTLSDINIAACCVVQHCVTPPECDCLQLPVCQVACVAGQPGTYSLTFTLQNLFALGPINEIHIYPQPPGSPVIVNPADFYFGVPIPTFGTTGPHTVTITGAQPGPLCLRFAIHLNGTPCCSEVKCFDLPQCFGGVGCAADVDDGSGTGVPDGGVTIDDLLYYLHVFDLGVPQADVDDGSFTGTLDGAVTIEDLLYYLFVFDRGC